MGAQADKSLAHSQNERLRAEVRKVIDRDFEGKVSWAAPKFGVSGTTLHEFLVGTRGAGTKLLRGIADYTGRGIDELLGRTVTTHMDTQGVREGDELRQHPQWPGALQAFEMKLERRGQSADREVVQEMGTVSMSRALPTITVEFVARLYEALLQAKEDEERDHGP